MKALLIKIRQILRDRRTRRFLTRFVSGIAAIVVFVTTYALVLPAITMESQAACGIEAHQHDDSCYSEELICGQEESEGHHHTDDCYTVTRKLECHLEEHQHSAENGCFAEDGSLICTLEEHSHTDSCYEEHMELTCGLEETEGHYHTDSCYQKVLTCGKPVHTHSAACYKADPEVESAAVASTGMTSAAAVIEDDNTFDDSIVTKAEEGITADFDQAGGDDESVDADADRETFDARGKEGDKTGTEITDEAGSTSNTINNTADHKDTDGEGEEAASSFSTGFAADEDAENGNVYIPEKDALDFYTVLNKKTGIYFHHVAEDEDLDDSLAITDWTRVEEDTELSPEDLIRVYLSYTLPKDTVNATNDIARYRLPDTLHLTDDQIEAINKCENGISAQYIDYDHLEITDPERHTAYLGLESVEGTRLPGEELKEDSTEYISAVVRAEKIYDEETSEYEGTDLIFTFSPYAVEKNAHAYDKKGQPTRAGEEVTGWLTLDFNIGQIDWAEDNTSEIIFAEEDQDNNFSEIRTVLKKAGASEDVADDSAADGMTETASEYVTEEIAAADATGEAASSDNTSEKAEKAGTGETVAETAEDLKDEKDTKEEITAANYPAAVFDDSITVHSGRLDTDLDDTDLPRKSKMTVHVEADEGTFPEGTKMVLSAVKDLDAVAEVVGTAVDARTRGFQAVDITFYDKDPSEEDAKEIEPLKPIRVSIKSDEIRKAAEDSSTAPVVVHIEDDNSATEIENTASKTDSSAIEIEKPGVEAENAVPESDNMNNTDVPARQDQTADENDADASDSDRDYIGADTENEEPQTKNTDAESTINPSTDSSDVQENQSDNNTEASEEDLSAATVSETKDIPAEENADPVAENSSDGLTGMNDGAADDAVNFEADSFSIYAVVYTVDFHYTVNGQEFEYSIAGGSYISIAEIVAITGIADQEPDSKKKDAESEASDNADSDMDASAFDKAAAFVEGIANVEFSNPEYIRVIHANEDTTVGEMKGSLGLECEYSSKLTEEEIAAINATTIKAGEWGLISLKAFDTEETLTVTMDNGDTFTIKVTDANDPLGIDDRTVSFVYLPAANALTHSSNNGYDIYTGSGYAVSYDSSNNFTRKAVTFEKKNGVEYCDLGTNVWLFEYVDKKTDPNYGKYFVSNGYHSDESIAKYLTFDEDGNLKLVTGKYQTNSTGDYILDSDGKPVLNAYPVTITREEVPRATNDGNSVNVTCYQISDGNGHYACYKNNNFRTGTENDNINLCFCLPEAFDDDATHKATLQSVQDVKPGQDVIIYRRVLQDDFTYHYYAIDGNGAAQRVYDNSDSIFWQGDVPVEWEIHDLGGYYAFYNPTTKTYLAPKTTSTITMSEAAYTGDEQDIRISLPGKIAGTYTSKISYWYDEGNMTNGLQVTEGSNHNSASTKVVLIDESDEFYFAVRDPAVQKELTEIDTVDSDDMGIKITMYDFDGTMEYTNPTVNGSGYIPKRLIFMDAIMGNEFWDQGVYDKGFVSRVLDADGYPVIVSNDRSKRYWSGDSVVNNSLSLLFENDTRVPYGDTKKGIVTKTENVNHIFLQNVYDSTGYFHYSCFENAAYLNGNNFEVYEQLATSRTDSNIYARRGNFWPYDIPKPELGNRTNDFDPDLFEYGTENDPYSSNGVSSFPRAGEDVYYVNELNNPGNPYAGYKDPNCFFGMIMEAKFTQNPNGISDRGDPMVFEFNGDDDLWIYVDKVLLLDLGGVHDAFRGNINFQTGQINVISPTEYNINYTNNTYTLKAKGHVVETTYIKQQFYEAGKLPDGSDWPTQGGNKLKSHPDIDKYFTDGGVDAKGQLIGTFKDLSTHDFKMFYMERGAGASQLEMSFNLPVLRESAFRVRKEIPETESNHNVQDDYANKPFYYEVYKGTIANDINHNGVIDFNELEKCTRSDFVDGSTHEMTAKYDDSGRSDVQWVSNEDDETRFILKPGQTAIFPAPNSVQDKVYWYVVEVDKDVSSRELNRYEVTNSDPDTSVNGDPANPTVEDPTQPGTYTGTYTNGMLNRQLRSNVDTIKARNLVTYYNFPDDTIANELQIKKKITGVPYEDESKNTFEYRILLENTDGKLFVYREGDYYQIDKDGNYIYFDSYINGNGKRVTERRQAERVLNEGKLQYKYTYHKNATQTFVEWTDDPKPTEKTSPRGTLGNILDGDTIIVKGLLDGTKFYVYERTNGYDNMWEWEQDPRSNEPKEGRYVVNGIPEVTGADEWNVSLDSTFEEQLEEVEEIASFSVSDSEKEHAATGIIKKDEDAKVLIKNKPYSELDFSVKKNWLGMDSADSSLEDSKIKITLGRYALIDDAGTLVIRKDGVPAGADFYARYVIKKITITDEHPEGVEEDYKVVYYSQNIADGNGVTVSVEPGKYTVTEEIIYQDDEGYTWNHSYETTGAQTASSENNHIAITTNQIDDKGNDTVVFKCEPQPQMKTGNLCVTSTLNDGDSGINLADVYYIVYAGDQNSKTRATYPNGKKVPVIMYSEASQTGGYLINGLKAGTYTVREYRVPDTYGTYERDTENSTNHYLKVTVPGDGLTATADFVNTYKRSIVNATVHVTSDRGGVNITNSTDFHVGDVIRISYLRNNSEPNPVPVTVTGGTLVTNQSATTHDNNWNFQSYCDIELTGPTVEIVFNNTQGNYSALQDNTPTIALAPSSGGRSLARSFRGAKNAALGGARGESSTINVLIGDTGEKPDAPEGKKYVEDTTFTMVNPDYDPEDPDGTGPEIIDYTIVLDQSVEWTWDTITASHYFPATDDEGNPYYYYIKSVEEIGIPNGTTCVVKTEVGENEDHEEVEYQFLVGGQDQHYDAEHEVYDPLEVDNIRLTQLSVEKKWNDDKTDDDHPSISYKLYRIPYRIVENEDYDPEETDPDSPNYSQTKRINYTVEEVVNTKQDSMDGKVLVSAMEGYTGILGETNPENPDDPKNWKDTITKLPKGGWYTPTGQTKPIQVLYEYYVSEISHVDGYKQSITGGFNDNDEEYQYIIKNEPLSATDKFTQINIQKDWLDAKGEPEDGLDLHKNDVIEFEVVQTRYKAMAAIGSNPAVNTELYPITINLWDEGGTPASAGGEREVDQVVVYVPKGADFTVAPLYNTNNEATHVVSVGGSPGIEVVPANARTEHYEYTPATADAPVPPSNTYYYSGTQFRFNDLDSAKEITLWLRAGYDQWKYLYDNDDPTNYLKKAEETHPTPSYHVWTCQLYCDKQVIWDLQEVYHHIIEEHDAYALEGDDAAVSTTYRYEMKLEKKEDSDEYTTKITPLVTAPGTGVPDPLTLWKGSITELPLYEFVKENDSNTYIYTYRIVEKTVNSSEVKPLDTPAQLDGSTYNYYSSSYLVSWQTTQVDPTQPSVMAVTNRKMPVIKAMIHKVDKSNLNEASFKPLSGAAFKLIKLNLTNGSWVKDETWENQGEKPFTEDADHSGVFNLGSLKEGYYKIVETQFPDGYIKSGEDPIIQVKMDNVTGDMKVVLVRTSNPNIGTEIGSDSTDIVKIGNETETDGSTMWIFRFGNEPGVELPNSGGPGTNLFYLTGCILTMLACMGIVMGRKRRNAA